MISKHELSYPSYVSPPTTNVTMEIDLDSAFEHAPSVYIRGANGTIGLNREQARWAARLILAEIPPSEEKD